METYFFFERHEVLEASHHHVTASMSTNMDRYRLSTAVRNENS